MTETPTCVICSLIEQRSASARNQSGFVCSRCEAHHEHPLNDDGRAEERHLTILAIDVDG